jgi:mono/diheme cytochrome c family protein
MKFNPKYLIATSAVAMFAVSCTIDPDSPGTEYMPDMYRSPAIEAYVDYGMDPYLVGEDAAKGQRNTPSARKPVKGTIPYKGESGLTFGMPYPLPNTPEGYERAATEIKNPLPLTKEHFEKGKGIYEKMCIHCHGEKGAGDGSMTEEKGGKYPIVPSYQSRKGLEQGKMYHTIQYGKGLMGSHASQLNQKERWQVIHYVTALMNESTPDFENPGNTNN